MKINQNMWIAQIAAEIGLACAEAGADLESVGVTVQAYRLNQLRRVSLQTRSTSRAEFLQDLGHKGLHLGYQMALLLMLEHTESVRGSPFSCAIAAKVINQRNRELLATPKYVSLAWGEVTAADLENFLSALKKRIRN